MNEDLNQSQREQLSALADGQLAPADMAQALAFADSGEGRQTWQLYQLVGDVLRSPDLAHHAQHDVLSGVRAQLAREPRPAPPPLSQVAAAGPTAPDRAANSAVFRWKLVAGLASVVAVAALAWTALPTGGSGVDTGMQLAEGAAPLQSVPAATMVAMQGDGSAPVMLRDPRLDELLAAQRQYSSAAALQMPANFLRNANFSAPAPKP